MQLFQSTMHGSYGFGAVGERDPSILAAHRATFVALLSSVVEALERRRVADTLLEGKCTAAEEAWKASRVTSAPQQPTSLTRAEAVSMVAPLVGYDTSLLAGMCAVVALQNLPRFPAEFGFALQIQPFATVLST